MNIAQTMMTTKIQWTMNRLLLESHPQLLSAVQARVVQDEVQGMEAVNRKGNTWWEASDASDPLPTFSRRNRWNWWTRTSSMHSLMTSRMMTSRCKKNSLYQMNKEREFSIDVI